MDRTTISYATSGWLTWWLCRAGGARGERFGGQRLDGTEFDARSSRRRVSVEPVAQHVVDRDRRDCGGGILLAACTAVLSHGPGDRVPVALPLWHGRERWQSSGELLQPQYGGQLPACRLVCTRDCSPHGDGIGTVVGEVPCRSSVVRDGWRSHKRAPVLLDVRLQKALGVCAVSSSAGCSAAPKNSCH